MWPGADKPPRSDRARTRHFVPLSDVLLAIAPAAGLGRVAAAAEVATALGYDIDAALEEPDGYWQLPSWPPCAGQLHGHHNRGRHGDP
jgi:hypothetical protein